MNLYQENIIDHYQNPRHWGKLKNPDKIAEGANVFCGDEVKYFLELDQKQKIKKIAWNGRACAICTASASILSEQILGQSLNNIKKMTKEDIIKNLGIELSPTRLKCALLPLETLKKVN